MLSRKVQMETSLFILYSGKKKEIIFQNNIIGVLDSAESIMMFTPCGQFHRANMFAIKHEKNRLPAKVHTFIWRFGW